MSGLNTSPDTSLALPAPADPSTEPRTDGKTQMDVDGKSVPLDHLGPMIINTDGVRSLTYMQIVHRLIVISRPVDDFSHHKLARHDGERAAKNAQVTRQTQSVSLHSPMLSASYS